MLQGIIPIVFIPFTQTGKLDEAGLVNIVRFELEGGVDGIGINGFASEAYKLTDAERQRAVEIVAAEVAGQVPLIIGLAPGSTEAAVEQGKALAPYNAAALMVLPPATMDNGPGALVEHYVRLGDALNAPIMVQQSPHIPQYSHCGLPAELLAEMAHRSAAIQYFKIEGPGAAARMAALRPLISMLDLGLFGGGGGVTFPDELHAGAEGLIPGVGFNEVFIQAWQAYTQGQHEQVQTILQTYQPLVDAVSAQGHEYSLHARKVLMQRSGYIRTSYVRSPTVVFTKEDEADVYRAADRYKLRISR